MLSLIPTPYKWAAIGIGLLAIAGGSYFKGRQHSNEKWEAKEAAALVLAATEKARIATEHAQELSKYQEKEKADEKARTDLAAANAGLRHALARYRGSPAIVIPSDPKCPSNDLLGSCANLLREVTGRGAERVADCLEEVGELAGIAETERGKAELSNSLYESIRNRTVK